MIYCQGNSTYNNINDFISSLSSYYQHDVANHIRTIIREKEDINKIELGLIYESCPPIMNYHLTMNNGSTENRRCVGGTCQCNICLS